MTEPTVTRQLPSGEFAIVEQIAGSSDWQVIYWSSREDYAADMATGGAWFDRATVSVAVDSLEDALAELADPGTS